MSLLRHLRRRWRGWTVAILVLFCCALVFWWLVPMPGRSDVPSFEIPVGGGGDGILRVKATDDGDLLILPPQGYPTYEYNTGSGGLREVAFYWEFDSKSRPGDNSIYVGVDDNAVLCRQPGGGLRRHLVERKIVRFWESPDEAVVAVLTTRGWKRPSIDGFMWPIGGTIGGGYTGQHYVEFLQLPQLTPLGEPIRVRFTSAGGFLEPAWSPDSRYIVFAAKDGDWICVIPTGL